MASLKKLSKPRPQDNMPPPTTGPKPGTLGPNVGGGQKPAK